VQAVVEKRYEATGARLLDSDVMAGRMVELLCLGNGVKRVAKILEVSPHCVRAARRKLEEQGKLAPLKERFVTACGEIMEEGAKAVLDAIISGKMHPNFIGSTVGIFFDKRALALGEPTSISVGATAQLRPEALSVKALNSWMERLPGECESTGNGHNHAQIDGGNVVEAVLVTESGQPTDQKSGEAVGADRTGDLAGGEPGIRTAADGRGGGGGAGVGGGWV
jgi:hypothetical protein